MTPEILLSEWAWLLMDSFARAGIEDVIVSPGSRSTPFVLAAANHPNLRCRDVIDERSAAFFALGQARATGRPSLLLCTSGTAGANYFPAVVEATRSGTPLLVLTADRPLELTECGAAQTVDQVKLFGDHALHFFDLGTPDPAEQALCGLRRQAAQAFFVAQGPPAGAVQLNARARKPLEPREPVTDGDRRLRRRVRRLAQRPIPSGTAPRRLPAQDAIEAVTEAVAAACLRGRRGLIVCGPGPVAQREARAALHRLAAATRYPILAETASQLRFTGQRPAGGAVQLDHFDTLLHSPAFRRTHEPEVVLQIGNAPTSAVWERYLSEYPGCRRFVLADSGWPDPTNLAEWVIHADLVPALEEIARALEEASPEAPTTSAARTSAATTSAATTSAARTSAWTDHLARADALAGETVEAHLGKPLPGGPEEGLTEGAAARALIEALPAGSLLGVANSLPIRLVETWAGTAPKDLTVWSQRGANGIDGVVSGFLGAASKLSRSRPAGLLIGDVSFLHDLGGLAAARHLEEREVPTVLLVLNNDGGRIFEQLPVADLGLPESTLDHWLTPHGHDLGAAAALFGLKHRRVETPEALTEALEEAFSKDAVSLVEAIVPPHGAVAQHRRLWEAVDERLAALGPPPRDLASEAAHEQDSYVLLHGFTGTPGCWDRLRACLPPEAKVFAPALLGHDPELPQDAPAADFEGEVDRLAREIESRGFAGSHLVGYSLGGRVALGLLTRHQHLFSAATLIGAHPGLGDEASRRARRSQDERWDRLLEERGLDAFIEAWQELPLLAPRRRLSRKVREDQRRRRRSHRPAGLAQALRRLGLAEMPDRRPALRGLDLPVRLMAGAQDEKFRGLAEEMAGFLPNAHLEIVPDCGHNVPLEAPCLVATALRAPLPEPATTPSIER